MKRDYERHRCKNMPQEKQNKKKRKTTFSNINFYDRKTPKENERYT